MVETLDIGTGSPLEIYSAPYKVSVDEVDTGYAPSCPTRYKADPDPVPDRSSVVKGALPCFSIRAYCFSILFPIMSLTLFPILFRINLNCI